MKDIYNSLNKRRPSFLDEIIVTGYEHRGPAPKIYDIKHLTPYLCTNQDREVMIDVVSQILGDMEVCIETTINVDWPRKLSIPVYVKLTCKSLSAKARFFYSSSAPDKCWM